METLCGKPKQKNEFLGGLWRENGRARVPGYRKNSSSRLGIEWPRCHKLGYFASESFYGGTLSAKLQGQGLWFFLGQGRSGHFHWHLWQITYNERSQTGVKYKEGCWAGKSQIATLSCHVLLSGIEESPQEMCQQREILFCRLEFNHKTHGNFYSIVFNQLF